jgi:hypothetical protein
LYICEKLFSMNLDNDKEFQKKLQKSYERLGLVNVIIAFILSIPTMRTIHLFKEYSFQIVLLYLILVIFGILYSPSIVNRIWK